MDWVNFFSAPKSRAAIAFAFALALTLILFTARHQLESDKADIDFAQRANIRIAALTSRITASLDNLQAVNQLFMVSADAITREQFHQFTQPYLSRSPYIQAFVFHRLVTREEREAYEARLRSIFPEFSIRELRDGRLVRAAEHDVYVVDEYIEPMKGNAMAFGYNSMAEPPQAAAFWRAAETGRPTATPLKPLLQGRKKGIVILMPVYRHGAPLTDAASRRAAVIGDTEVVFIAENMVTKIFEDTGVLVLPGIHINVYAAAGIQDDKLVFRHGGPPLGNRESASRFEQFFLGKARSIDHTFDLAGMPWHIVVSSAAPSIHTVHFGSLLILLTGTLLSFGFAFRIYGLATQSQRIENLVRRRTAELRATANALQLRQRAIEASPNAIVIASAKPPDFPIEYVNPAFERITGYAASDIMGKPMCRLHGTSPDSQVITELEASLHTRQEGRAVFRQYRKDGSLYWNDMYIAPVKDESNVVHHYVCMQYDVTETKRYEEELEFRANHDTLTGLANRNLLHDRLIQAISYASRYQHAVWVVFIDLDRFKFVNDSSGHGAGDELLRTMAKRLQSMISDVDTAARLGGDEFILVIPGDGERRGIVDMITRLLDEIAKPVQVQGQEFFATCSMGIAVYPNDGTDPDALISHADIAMFRAKKLGGNNFKFFETSMNEATLKRLQLEGDLRKALDQDEFELHYQPQVDLRTGKVAGVEALIRWHHPAFGFINPGRFIGLAEETGLIVQIGKWTLLTACAQNKAWQDAGLGHFTVAVNLSALEFAQPDIVQTIAAVLEQTGLSPAYLEVEMTESMVMDNVEDAVPKLKALKQLGVKLSVDDFGTGYSSLSYLTRFPIDVLKIDQSFVRNIPLQRNSATLVTSIISIAHNLDLRVIAEGVETPEQLDFLHSNGCDEIQGHYCSKPLSASKLEQLLMQDKSLEVLAPRS